MLRSTLTNKLHYTIYILVQECGIGKMCENWSYGNPLERRARASSPGGAN